MLHVSKYDKNVSYKLCVSLNDVTPGEIRGAQQIRGLWKVYVKSEASRQILLTQGFTLNNKNIKLFDSDPFEQQSVPSEKITIRDVPMDCDDGLILEYLRDNHPHIAVRSNIISAKIMDNNYNATEFLSGDRYFYVQSGFEPVLPEEVTIGDATCRIWHPSQELKCKRCHEKGHRAYDLDNCKAYKPVQPDIKLFWKDSDPLSNFYSCNVFVFNRNFKSSEHAYQTDLP